MAGWMKLHRQLTKKAIWQCSTPEQKVILITLLMMANYERNEWEWQGEKFLCEPGQFITSLQSIVDNAGKGITIQNVRTALKKFEKYDFLTNKSTKTGRLITIVNWGLYQAKEENLTNELTNNQQRANKELTSKKKDKKDKEEIYNILFSTYNSQGIIKHKELTSKMEQAINKALKEYRQEEIMIAITRYGEAFRDNEYEYCKYRMTLDKFLTQKNGMYDWLDEGQKWITYSNFKNKTKASDKDDIYNVNGR